LKIVTDIDAAAQQLRISTGVTIDYIYKHVFKGVAVTQMSSVRMTAVLDNDIVKRATRNMRVYATMTEQTDAPWGIDRIVPPLDSTYSYDYDGTGVQVFILDTGIHLSHNEFNGRATCGFTGYDDNCEDIVQHGTHVAGIVGGQTFGVAKNVDLVAVKVLDNDGSGPYDVIFAGIDYVIEQKIASSQTPMVINMSLGGPSTSFMNDAVQAAVNNGIVVVVAAGNNGSDACRISPASARSAITVGSTTMEDKKSSFSNIGRCVDIFAPGSSIRSASSSSNDASVVFSGTSMASPIVAGVAALHLEKTPALTPAQVWLDIKNDYIFIRIRSSWWLNWIYGSSPNRLLGTASLFL
jgi:subtilisin family serine protease